MKIEIQKITVCFLYLVMRMIEVIVISKKDRKCYITNEKEEKYMAVLAKPINKIAVIKERESRDFVRKFNKNKVNKEFLDSCKKAGRLFGKQK